MRNCLKKNKIYFETVASTSLAIMAIIVAAANLYVGADQRNLIQIQTKVAEANLLPRFEIAIRQILNPATGKFDDNELHIENNGGAVRSFHASVRFFMSFEGGKGGSAAKIEVPVAGYFGTNIIGSAGTGKLATFLGYHNNAKRAEIAQKFRVAADVQKFDFAYVDERIVIKINYTDLLEKQHLEYFSLKSVGYAERMPELHGAIDFANSSTGIPVELADLDAASMVIQLQKSFIK